MFQKLAKTAYPPEHPLLVWDGKCGFCKYWVIRWKHLTGDALRYAPYQKVAVYFPDIEERHFREAVRLIMPDGKIYSGPQAAYMSIKLGGRYPWLEHWYRSSAFFRWLSDHGYQWVSDHRPLMMRLTKAAAGKNPLHPRPYWAFYLMLAVALLLLLL